MKAYVMTTGLIFCVVTVAHIWRMITENPHLVTDPVYISLTVLSGGLFLWALFVLRRVKG